MKINRYKILPITMIYIFFLYIIGTGCASKEEQKTSHLKRARQYFEKMEYKKARIEFLNVVQLDPNDDTAYYELGETYQKLRQPEDALQSYNRAILINPDNLKAQLKIARFFLSAKMIEEGKKKAELVLERSPENIDALVILSEAMIRKNDYNSASSILEKALAVNPEDFKAILMTGRLAALQNRFEQSQEAYQKAISINPSSRIPYMELSRIYVKKGMWDRAETELKRMVQASETMSEELLILARFYETWKKWKQAEKTYLEAVNFSAKDDESPLMNLGAFYSRRKSYDNALNTFKQAASIKEGDPDILIIIAKLHIDFKKINRAEEVIDKILKKDKGNVKANFLKGWICLDKKDFQDAGKRFDYVLRENPDNAEAHYFRALCMLEGGEIKLAEQHLVKSLELAPGLLKARLLLTECYLKERHQDLARLQIDKLLDQAPDNVLCLMAKGNLKIIEKDFNEAEAVFQQIIKQSPGYAPAYIRLAKLCNFLGEREKAIENLKKVLETDRRQIDALSIITGIYIKDERFDQAVRVCEEQKEINETDASFSAAVENLEGNIYLAKKDFKMARHHFEKAINIDPDILAPYPALAKLSIEEKEIDKAISKYKAMLKKNPEYLAGYMALGIIYEKNGDEKKAEAVYREAIEIKNDFGPAANNLAWNLAETGGNIDEALRFARIAKEKLPDSPVVMDTLGWIYYLKGSYLNAISEFQAGLECNPDNPLINYHMGLAYYREHKPDMAKTFLENALSIDRNFKGSGDARDILAHIKTVGP
ncbi:MAG: tetratricopeptide repeat protein [Deltaproteobacteria bacterium]|nr:tetratricopeptide repeat protein [Deltaproteobacteria bacterium]